MGTHLLSLKSNLQIQTWPQSERSPRRKKSSDSVHKSPTARTFSAFATCTPRTMIPSFTLPISQEKKPSPESPVVWRSKPIEMKTLRTLLCRPHRMLPLDARKSVSPLYTSRSEREVVPSKKRQVQVVKPLLELWLEPA